MEGERRVYIYMRITIYVHVYESVMWFRLKCENLSRQYPEGRPGMFDVSLLSGISGLSFDSPFLSPLLFFSA